MPRTKIDWADYSVNPIKGLCKNNCWYCYARKMYKRFKWNPEVRLDLDCLDKIEKIKKPSRIFVGSMHEIFGNWISNNWIQAIIGRIRKYKKHTFIFLSKFPERYQYFDFPENCLLGTTITHFRLVPDLWRLTSIKVFNGFISIEPLLGDLGGFHFGGISWIIMGGLTPKPVHKKEWVEKIINQARELNIPIFIKDNLKWEEKIQEFPILIKRMEEK